jgi:hypothetical protein
VAIRASSTPVSAVNHSASAGFRATRKGRRRTRRPTELGEPELSTDACGRVWREGGPESVYEVCLGHGEVVQIQRRRRRVGEGRRVHFVFLATATGRLKRGTRDGMLLDIVRNRRYTHESTGINRSRRCFTPRRPPPPHPQSRVPPRLPQRARVRPHHPHPPPPRAARPWLGTGRGVRKRPQEENWIQLTVVDPLSAYKWSREERRATSVHAQRGRPSQARSSRRTC